MFKLKCFKNHNIVNIKEKSQPKINHKNIKKSDIKLVQKLRWKVSN